MANSIQKSVAAQAANNPEKRSLQALIKQMEPEIKKALPSVITPERFTRMVFSAVSMNPALASCDGKSFLGAMMQAAQLGLEPNTALGQAYILPYRNHGEMEAQFQIGYRGSIELAYRSGDVISIEAHTVYENDKFEYELGLEPKLNHVPAVKDRGEAIAFWAMFKTKNGGYGYEVMSIDDIRNHAKKYSKSYSSGYSPWSTNFEEMAKKTVIKRVLKYAPMKTEFVKAIMADETIKTDISEDMFDVPDSTVIEGEFSVDESTGEVTENA